uniref:Anion exchange protein n=1 Tax=Anolis carolinensis TaxID=28377 RepID=A0A803SZB9_ANOCA
KWPSLLCLSFAGHRFEDVPGVRRHLVRKSTKGQVVHLGKDRRESSTRTRKTDRQPHEVFVELNELIVDKNQEMQWKETARWIKFEEDVEEETDRWGKPHVASLSFRSLLELRRTLSHGAVLLDLDQKTLPGVAHQVVEQMIISDQIRAEDRANVLRALLLKHSHPSDEKEFSFPRNISAGSLGSLLSHHHSTNHIGDSAEPAVTDPLIGGHMEQETRVDIEKEVGHRDGGGISRSKSKHELKLLEKIPENAEATVVLVGSVDFLDQPTMAFVRLQEAAQLDAVLEVPIPVRFLFVLLGPQSANMDYHEIGRSISTLMSDKQFHEAAYLADDRQDLLHAINEFLDCSVVLPPSEVQGEELLRSVANFQREMLRRREEQERRQFLGPEGVGRGPRKRCRGQCPPPPALPEGLADPPLLGQIFQAHPLNNCLRANTTDHPMDPEGNWTTGNTTAFVGELTGQPNTALLSLVLMGGTFFIGFFLRKFKNSRFFPGRVRRMIGDFGVPIAILVMVLVDYNIRDTYTQKLSVPRGLSVTDPDKRGWVINPLGEVDPFPVWMMVGCGLPAMLVFILIFMETQITTLIISKKERKLRKGSGFHLDLLIIVALGGFCALFGLPWLTAATVRSVTHTNALTVMSKAVAPGDKPKVQEVREQRVTGFLVAFLVGLSIVISDLLRKIPLSVLFGIFLYMGITSLNGIQFYERLKLLLMPAKHHPEVSYVKKVRTVRMHLFTLQQLSCLAVLGAVIAHGGARWVLSLNLHSSPSPSGCGLVRHELHSKRGPVCKCRPTTSPAGKPTATLQREGP